MHGTTTKRTGARAWVQIVPTPFPQYGGIITPPRVWRQIVRWMGFFNLKNISFISFKKDNPPYDLSPNPRGSDNCTVRWKMCLNDLYPGSGHSTIFVVQCIAVWFFHQINVTRHGASKNAHFHNLIISALRPASGCSKSYLWHSLRSSN